jgi:flavin reductase (DIM6/NTAB) family NADH-FMN oxidoreductase RutF
VLDSERKLCDIMKEFIRMQEVTSMKVNLGAQNIFFPVPAALVVSGVGDSLNIITLSWIGMASSTPPTVGISVKSSRHTLGLIRQTREFTVNIPSSGQYAEVDYCGIVSGRKRDKFSDTGLTPLEGSKVSTSIIKECPFNIECIVVDEIKLGEYFLVLGEIVESHVDEDKMGTHRKGSIDISKVDPLVYCASVREYWKLGNKLGDAFNVGNKILRP